MKKNKAICFAPYRTCFCSSTCDLSLNLRHWLSKFSSVEFCTLSNDGYQQTALNNLLFAYKGALSDLPFPDRLNILGINYNLSQDISRYLRIDCPPNTEQINKLAYNLRLDPYKIHTDIRDNSLYLASIYKELYKKIK